MPQGIYRVNSPFTSRTVYYTTTGIADLTPDRNQFITNNNTPPCDDLLFQGESWELLNSLDPIETPTIFQFKSDDTTCSGYVSNVVYSEISINLFSNPDITEFELFGEVFTQNNGTWPISLTDHEFFGPSYSIQDRLQSIVNLVNGNANLNWRFAAYITTNLPTSVVIRALYPGSQYNFVLGSTIKYNSSTGGSSNFDYTINSQDNNKGMRYQNYGYKMFLEIWEIDIEWLKVGSDAFADFNTSPKRLITTLEQNWNPSNIFSFDVSKFFSLTKDISLYPQIPQPIFEAYTNQQIVFAPATTKQPIQGYFLRWGESFQGGLSGPVIGQIEGGITYNGISWELNVTTAAPGTLEDGQFIVSAGSQAGATILSQISGIVGGTGVYLVNAGPVVAPGTTFDVYDFNNPIPLEPDPWNITITEWSKVYIDTSEIRWASNGMYNLGILVLFNDHPERWLSVNANQITHLSNDYQTVKVSQDSIRGELEGQSGIKRVYKLRRRIDEPEYLAIYIHNDTAFSNTFDLRIFTEWTFINGGTATSTTHLTTALSKNDLYEVNVQNSLIQLDAVESASGLRVLYWSHTIQIRRDGINWTDLSEPVWYQLDLNNECDKYRKIWWIGTEGTTESFEFEGVTSMELNYEADYMTKSFTNQLYERQSHIKQAITKVPSRQFILNTGWLTTDQMPFIESLLKTPYVWWLNKYRLDLYFGNGQLLPTNFTNFEAINIVDSSYKIDNVAKLFNVEIVIEYSVPENTSY
jgi:hypothetical protein